MCASFTVGIAFYMCWFTYRKTYIVCCIYGAICAVLTLKIACSVLGESTVLCIYNSWENLVLGLAVSCCIRATSTTKNFFYLYKKSFPVAAHGKKSLDIHAQDSTAIWGNFRPLEKKLFFVSYFKLFST